MFEILKNPFSVREQSSRPSLYICILLNCKLANLQNNILNLVVERDPFLAIVNSVKMERKGNIIEDTLQRRVFNLKDQSKINLMKHVL